MDMKTCHRRMYMSFFSAKDFVFYLDKYRIFSFHVDSDSKYAMAIILLLLFACGVELLQGVIRFLNYKISNSNSQVPLRILLCITYFLFVAGSYLLMLAIMTFSTGVFLSICSGLALGYFILETFMPRFLRDGFEARTCH
ncbi:hypothetical protein SteCoe_8379 [Stentor coeruleus]|uniref:Copper transport protein n=1 Tax=Stentor coeruleus TaxID=5963 RepID=A0A1R2CKF3_9CILI|nr:hypothetical protein SteCoe_8379 [Stentor coeruleus]